ncbi:uncharacterized protein VTP21DRAFT_1322 [Calcarisporiella thermophila]|uniref:uncharacterized protein n=1 Tax=Calcarisporiella thermophila TaxID=911321 RepID=UPI0037441E5F
MKACCFCIDLRTATIFLSLMGILSHVFSGITLSSVNDMGDDQYLIPVVSAYNWIAALACALGFAGVFKKNAALVKVFSIYYWLDLSLGFAFITLFSIFSFGFRDDLCDAIVEQPDLDITREECLANYYTILGIALAAQGICLLIKLHFSLAIWNYYRALVREEEQYSVPYSSYYPGNYRFLFGTPGYAYSNVPQHADEAVPPPYEDTKMATSASVKQ